MDAQERRKKALEALGVTEGTDTRPNHHQRRGGRIRKVSTHIQDRDFEKQQKKREYWSCRKKMRYATHGLATIAAHRAFTERGVKLRVYDCRYCGGWHLTKSLRKGGAE